MIQVRIRWQASYRHDELPFLRPSPQFMGRKLVRKNQLSLPGGLLSFPRTGCALRAAQSYHQARESGNPVAPAPSPDERAEQHPIRVRHLPFSWHHGWWLGCWIDGDGHSDRCKLWGAGLKNPVVFDGQYVSCETHFAVAADELKLKAPSDSMQMWVGVPSEERLAPAIFLQNGEHLVPIEATHGCEELMEKLKPKP
jgi:hypothetical protein